MFGIGFGEMLIIGVVLLIAVGPRQLPAMMKTLGRGIRDVRRAAEELRRSTGIDELMRDEELRNPFAAADKPTYHMTLADRERENPREGLDIVHARIQAELGTRVAQDGGSGDAQGA